VQLGLDLHAAHQLAAVQGQPFEQRNFAAPNVDRHAIASQLVALQIGRDVAQRDHRIPRASRAPCQRTHTCSHLAHVHGFGHDPGG
jgi:hypothetical protein